MSAISMYSFTREDIEDNAQAVKHVLLDILRKNGDITVEAWEEYSRNYAILCRKPTFFSSFWKKFASKEQENSLQYIVVKQVNMEPVTEVDIEAKETKQDTEKENGKE
jgi:hypothetical protein